ncbi:shikimate dehydrogenase [soil metagenome]
MPLSGTTTVAGVIGSPVGHSLSPAIHNGAFAALELDWAFVAFEVPAGKGPAAVAAVAALGLGGLSVTMPHKSDVVAAVDRLSEAAEALTAVNCVVPHRGSLVGENTDGDGFIDALVVDHDIDPAGLRCVVFGAGGAARAVIRALGEAGAAAVGFVNRTPARAAQASALAGGVGRVAPAAAAVEADLVVNATPLGMAGGAGPLPIDVRRLAPGQVVVDLVYQPLETPLLAAARARGCVVVDGLGMLVHQAARAFELWTGERAPLDVMAAAARQHLAVGSGR